MGATGLSAALRHPGPRLGAGLAAFVLVLTAGLLASACSSSKLVLGAKASPCYRAIPIAREALRGYGHLVGVKQSDTATVLRELRAAGREVNAPRLLRGRAKKVCLLAYRGHFQSSDVAGAWLLDTPPIGYAVVVVSESPTEALATVLVSPRPAKLDAAFPLPG